MTDTEHLFKKIQLFLREDLSPLERSRILQILEDSLQESFDQGRSEGLDQGRTNDIRFYVP